MALLNELALDFASSAPPGTPALWVTSLTRSVQHQQHLRDLGYAAMIPSAHCFGFASDVEMRWFAEFGADQTLAQLLLERQKVRALQCDRRGPGLARLHQPGLPSLSSAKPTTRL